MAKINPIEALQNANATNNNIDMLYRGMKKYFLYFEDNGKEAFYKKLIVELFPEEKGNVYIDTTSTGKSDLTKKYFNNQEKYTNTSDQKFIFILDKDFDDKRLFLECKNLFKKTFGEIKTHNNFLVLNYYSIENYFLKNKEIIAEACFVAFGIDEQFLLDHFEKIQNLLIEVSKIIYISNVIDLENKGGVARFIDYLNICLKDQEIINVEKEYKKNFEERKNIIFKDKKCKKNFSYDNVKKIVLELFDNEKDIIGKELMLSILKIIKIKYDCREVNKDLFFRELLTKTLPLKDVALKELKEELSIIFKSRV